ncbi:MAG: thiol-disulfide oxidoreductase DCC family protein [Micromonosporaceae bacterium]
MTSQRPTFLYDGDCAFCSSCARFIQRRIRPRADVVPWQFTDLKALGVTTGQAEDAVQWINVDGSVASGADGIAALLKHSGWPWRLLGAALGLTPVLWLARPIYRLISRYRDKLPGGTAACALPQAERDRLRGTG